MSAPLLDLGLWIPMSVLTAGLIGSPHCVSMCGPIVMNYSVKRTRLLFYQLGRMISYVTVGAVAGAFGETVLGSSRPPWLTKLSLALIAIAIVINGYRTFSGQSLHTKMPDWISKISIKLWSAIRRPAVPPNVAAGLTGLLTVLLPCGHLYSFLLGAVATGSASGGALFMFAFWLGSSPLLVLTGIWLPQILKLREQRGRKWAGALLVIAGLLSLAAFGYTPTGSHNHHDHDKHPVETTEAVAHRCH